MNVNVGDIVRFLNAVGGGRVAKIQGQVAYVVDEDGFETPVLLRECVVVGSGDSFYKVEKPQPKFTTVAASEPKPDVAPLHQDPQPVDDFEETPQGEKLNLVIGFEPADIKHLSTSSFDAFVVNDSNYYLWLTVATRPAESGQWTLRFSGMIEPAMQEFAFELTHDDLPAVDRLCVHAVAFKRGKDYALKAPVAYENRLDATRFARLHCFGANPYFDGDVLAIDIVKDDQVQGRAKKVDVNAIETAMVEKQRVDRRAPRQIVKKRQPETSLLEIDLHASELLDSTAGLSKADILNYPVDYVRRIMDQNLRNIGREIIFIHGKGEGVLRQAIIKELNYRYKFCEVSDASFREYGFGATRVKIHSQK